MYYVYILRSLKDNKLYIGYSDNINRRIDEHNNGKVESTKYRRPLALIGYICFKERQKATNFEKYLKTGSGKAFLKKHFI